MVLDARTITEWSAADRQVFYDGMAAEGFKVTVNEQGIVVFAESDAEPASAPS